MKVIDFSPVLPTDDQKKRSLYLDVYDAIYQGVSRKGEGEKLPTEAEFADYWHVSRGTIREAMYHLQEDGFIEKGRGQRSQISSKDVPSIGYHFQMKGNPVLIALPKIDRLDVRHNLSCCSNWLSEHLNLASGAPLLNVTTDYYVGDRRMATSLYLLPFSLVENDRNLSWDDKDAWEDFVKTGLYEKASSTKCSFCMVQGPVLDSELTYVSTPALLSEEFLFAKNNCIAFNRSYYDQGNPRIRFLRK